MRRLLAAGAWAAGVAACAALLSTWLAPGNVLALWTLAAFCR